jgi:hypothetical protein
MSPVRWEHQALDSIQSALGYTDPKLASLLATFTRLAASKEMPAHEKVRSFSGPPAAPPPVTPAPGESAAPRPQSPASRHSDLAYYLYRNDHRRGDSQPRRSSLMSPSIWYLRRLGVRPTVTRARDLLLRLASWSASDAVQQGSGRGTWPPPRGGCETCRSQWVVLRSAAPAAMMLVGAYGCGPIGTPTGAG